MHELLTIKEASQWASKYLNKTVTTSNISYLIQYGKINKYGNNGNTVVSKQELINYYKSFHGSREINWKEKLGDDLNWHLSFDYLKEKDTTKHVHRLHPYKGKFIPQLVEYFLDSHIDEFKKDIYFKPGDIVLDPFVGSGTTLVQANELGIHAIGIDISSFNVLISNVKISNVDLRELESEIQRITLTLYEFIKNSNNVLFENELAEKLSEFNAKFFPSPDFKINVRQKKINEKKYGEEKEKEFLPIFYSLIKKYDLELRQKDTGTFLGKWYLLPVKNEIDFVFEKLKKVKNPKVKNVLTIILSRTIRSCRATTHADLATLKEPVYHTYYCSKHGKICKPLFSIFSWWKRYSIDTLNRLKEFQNLKTDTFQTAIKGDSRTINILGELEKRNSDFYKILKGNKAKGIFTSPPYVGLIDYHEQHAYAYDLFGFERNDENEIGPLYKGQGQEARKEYVESIAKVLLNMKRFLQENYEVFLVANDKYNLYPIIAEKANMKIVNKYKRPVLNRTEKDKSAYAEIIFHLREK